MGENWSNIASCYWMSSQINWVFGGLSRKRLDDIQDSKTTKIWLITKRLRWHGKQAVLRKITLIMISDQNQNGKGKNWFKIKITILITKSKSCSIIFTSYRALGFVTQLKFIKFSNVSNGSFIALYVSKTNLKSWFQINDFKSVPTL